MLFENEGEIRDRVFAAVRMDCDIPVETEKTDGVSVQFDGKKAVVGGCDRAALARAYFLLAKAMHDGTPVSLRQTRRFRDCGIMLDASRNGVMKVEAVKAYIDRIAALGMNFFMLYTEDTYEVKEYPLMGYLRGRYTTEELRAIDDYAASMGVEAVPCIQTLAHMQQFLRWMGPDSGIYDTMNILLADSEKTYDFIRAEIRAMKKAFRTHRIHIGMDEAHELGLGEFLNKNGYQKRTDIIQRHLERVAEICREEGLQPMMWGDMFLNGFCTDAPEPAEGVRKVPGVDMVFWDYYRFNKEYYDRHFKAYESITEHCIFAGGLTVWQGFLLAYDYSRRATEAALASCLENKAETVICTMWGDNGTEANAFLAFPLLPMYSEACYRGEEATMADVKEIASFLCGYPSSVLEASGNLMLQLKDDKVYFGKNYIYMDLLLNSIPEEEIPEEMMSVLERSIEEIDRGGAEHDLWLNYIRLVYRVCLHKMVLLRGLQKAYLAKDTGWLRNAVEVLLPQLEAELNELARVHETQWMQVYKPFGWEVLSFRYAGMIRRVQDCRHTLEAYLSGKQESIPELEEERHSSNMRYLPAGCFTPSAIF